MGQKQPEFRNFERRGAKKDTCLILRPKLKDLSYVLNFHGFRRINGESGQLEYASSNFVRGQPELLSKNVLASFRSMCREKDYVPKDHAQNYVPIDQAKKTADAFKHQQI